jgi:phosphatidylinositol glycan class V
MYLSKQGLKSPIRSLVALFAVWKAFLLLLAVFSIVGPSYDTSASLLLDAADLHEAPLHSRKNLATRLTSWDAIYFVQAARRGYLFEQEWAFGAGLPWVVSQLARGTGCDCQRIP